ncbi:MAG: hypothetical protein [Siphoviridae sp. ctCJE6]|nr:MAG: hypothetical protein [Siphoviridae sp. ctCJE6]
MRKRSGRDLSLSLKSFPVARWPKCNIALRRL